MSHLFLSLWLKLKELKNLQQQYLQMNQEVTELRPLQAQLQECQEQTRALQTKEELNIEMGAVSRMRCERFCSATGQGGLETTKRWGSFTSEA